MPLSQRTRDGYKVFYAGLRDTDPAHYDYAAATKFFYMLFDLWQFLEGSSPGYVVIVNSKGGQMGHAARVSPGFLKRSVQYLQEAAPIRLKGIHYINVHPVINVVLNLARPYLNKGLLDIVSFFFYDYEVNGLMQVELVIG